MQGELSPNMAIAIASSKAKKLLLPIHRSNIEIIGIAAEPLPHLVEKLLAQIRKCMEMEDENVRG
ncbi:hypothetical protein SDC9_105487 [bioreactor metagenome]|uniref:Uncharacterized protein n=1 Tax=bioreactor metagenome TaxID=1076179 RepID=A0A645AZK7_9ZZZZ